MVYMVWKNYISVGIKVNDDIEHYHIKKGLRQGGRCCRGVNPTTPGLWDTRVRVQKVGFSNCLYPGALTRHAIQSIKHGVIQFSTVDRFRIFEFTYLLHGPSPLFIGSGVGRDQLYINATLSSPFCFTVRSIFSIVGFDFPAVDSSYISGVATLSVPGNRVFFHLIAVQANGPR